MTAIGQTLSPYLEQAEEFGMKFLAPVAAGAVTLGRHAVAADVGIAALGTASTLCTASYALSPNLSSNGPSLKQRAVYAGISLACLAATAAHVTSIYQGYTSHFVQECGDIAFEYGDKQDWVGSTLIEGNWNARGCSVIGDLTWAKDAEGWRIPTIDWLN